MKALKKMRAFVRNALAPTPCPVCGRRPFAVYVSEFTFGKILLGAILPIFGAVVGMIFAVLKRPYMEMNQLPPYLGVGGAATAAGLLLFRWGSWGRRWLKKKERKVLGVRAERAGAAERKASGRWRFAFLGATETAAILAPGALFGAWGMGALPESLLEKYWIPATVAGVATALLAAGVAISVARSAKRLADCERFGFAWTWRGGFAVTARLGMEEKHWVKALEAIPQMDAFLAAESARTVELLRSASELTPEGAEALRIAEAEAAVNWEYAAAEKKDDAE